MTLSLLNIQSKTITYNLLFKMGKFFQKNLLSLVVQVSMVAGVGLAVTVASPITPVQAFTYCNCSVPQGICGAHNNDESGCYDVVDNTNSHYCEWNSTFRTCGIHQCPGGCAANVHFDYQCGVPGAFVQNIDCSSKTTQAACQAAQSQGSCYWSSTYSACYDQCYVVNAACGAKSAFVTSYNYPESASSWAGSYCQTGSQSSSPAFPGVGQSASWTCGGLGLNTVSCIVNHDRDCAGTWGACSVSCGGGTQSYTVTTPPAFSGTACPVSPQACNTQACTPIPGQCSGIAHTYSQYEGGWNGGIGYCATGSPDWNADFPNPGTQSSWTCQGSGGGGSQVCTATRTLNGACSATAGACTAGTASGDNNQTTCGTTRSWSCNGLPAGFGSNASCNFANPACPCTFTLSPTSASPAAAGGAANFAINVVSGSGCSWTATSNAAWITGVTANGTGNGTVSYTVAANAGAARSGTITAGGQTFTVNQGAAAACSFSLSPTSASPAAAGGAANFAINMVSGSGCSWTATSNAAWITGVTANGTGNGTISYTVAVNAGAARSGTITAGGQTFTVNQSGAYVATPTFNPGAGTYFSTQSVTISTTTPGASIYYTTNGSNPTCASTLFSAAIPVSATTTIKAIACRTNWMNSGVASAAYSIQQCTVPSGLCVEGSSYEQAFCCDDCAGNTGNVCPSCKPGYSGTRSWYCTGGVWVQGGSSFCGSCSTNCTGSIPANGGSNATSQASTPWTHDPTPGVCTFTCNTNYTWNGSACVDQTSPTITITDPLVNGNTVTSAVYIIRGTASDAIGVSSVKVRLNGGAWMNATGTNNWTYNAVFASGLNTINAQSFDAAGNPSAIVTRTITYNPPAFFYIEPASLTVYKLDDTPIPYQGNIIATTAGSVKVKPRVYDSNPNKIITVYVNLAVNTTVLAHQPTLTNADGNNNPACASATTYAACASKVWYAQSAVGNWSAGYQPTITLSDLPLNKYAVQVNASEEDGSTIGTPLTGYAVAETFGYISLSELILTPGVFPAGNIQGYAASESLGHISFRSGTPVSCTAQDETNYGVLIQNDNKLCGYAYSESIGWISFNDNLASIVSNAIVGFASSEAAGWIQF